MNDPTAEQRGIRCHAGPDEPAPAISRLGASSLDFWIPTFILLWRISRNDYSRFHTASGTFDKTEMVVMLPSVLRLDLIPAGCVKLFFTTGPPYTLDLPFINLSRLEK